MIFVSLIEKCAINIILFSDKRSMCKNNIIIYDHATEIVLYACFCVQILFGDPCNLWNVTFNFVHIALHFYFFM